MHARMPSLSTSFGMNTGRELKRKLFAGSVTTCLAGGKGAGHGSPGWSVRLVADLCLYRRGSILSVHRDRGLYTSRNVITGSISYSHSGEQLDYIPMM